MNSEQLGQRIKQAREHRALSQEDLGELVEKDQRAISEYESGKRRVLAIDLPALAQALNVSILYFFEGEVGETDLDRALLEPFHRLPSLDYQQTVINLLDQFCEAILRNQLSS